MQTKNSKCKFFPKRGGSTPKFTFLKSLYTVKRGSKMDFFNTRMCFGNFWEQQIKFWDTKFFVVEIVVKNFTFWGGGGWVYANLKRVYILNFLHPSLSAWLILAPMPHMHFLHKTFHGTSNNISCCAKFHSSSFLISWLPKISSFSLANWESTFFSQNLAVFNLSFTVHKLYTWLTNPTPLCCTPDISLVSSTGLWCPWQIGNNQTDLCETTRCSSSLHWKTFFVLY